MTQLNGKLMEEKLKRGWTVASFADYFQISEEDFLVRLKKTFRSNTYEGMKRRLEQNAKIRKKAEQPPSNSKRVDIPNISIPVVQKLSFRDLDLDDSETVLTKTEPKSHLETLKELEKDLSESLISLEGEHKELVQKRKSLKASLYKERLALIEFLKQLTEHRENFREIVRCYDNLSIEMCNKMSEISDKKSQLEDIRLQIEEQEKIQIFFYENGEIEFLGERNSFDVSDGDIDIMFNRFISNPSFENLTVKVIRQLAYLILLTQSLSMANKKYEIIFEDEAIEKIFEKFSSI